MIIIGLECPCCGGHVIDNGDHCLHCQKTYPPEIRAFQKDHHDQKMQNVEQMKTGTMTMPEALNNLPRVCGQSEDKMVVIVPGQAKAQKIDFKKKMDCDACTKAAEFFQAAVVRLKRIF